MLSIDCIRDETGLAQLETLWSDLLAKSGSNTVFLTFDWAYLWWKHFKAGKQLSILLIKDGGTHIALVPLVISRNRFFREVGLLGGDTMDYQDYIILDRREECLRLVLNYVSANLDGWDFLTVRRIRCDFPNAIVFQSEAKRRSRWARFEEFERAPYLPVDREWDEYYEGVDKKLRSDTVRQMRRLQEMGEVVFRTCESQDDLPWLMGKLVDYKSKRYEETRAKSGYSEPALVNFHLELAQRYLDKKWLDLSYLQVARDVVAIHFGFLYNNRFYYLMPAFNPDYARYSPSRILLAHLLQRSFERGLEFDFLFGQEAYKYQWAKQDRVLFRFLYFNHTPRGLLLREWFQSLRERVRKSSILYSGFGLLKRALRV